MNPQRVDRLLWCALILTLGLLPGCNSVEPSRLSEATRPPNFVVIFCDDLGYADISPFNRRLSDTPHLARMAAEGLKFTDFYAAQAVCSASRAALLTGCYPNRVGILGALPPKARIGINSSEWTIAEILKTRGYSTAHFGKWHLGDDPRFLPTRHGFDEYFGLPYSNDMWRKHPTAKFPPLPLIEGQTVIETDPDQTRLTESYTRRAVNFMRYHRDRPFFLYLAHNMPHVPLHVSDGSTGGSLYRKVIREIDQSVGTILRTLKELGLDENTMVVFASDNGPWLLYGDHAGSALPLREGKATTFDGGVRVPCIARWPGTIPQGSECRAMATTMDLLPTFAAISGAPLPADRIIDGKDIRTLLFNPRHASSRHSEFYYYWGEQLQAVRSGDWKLHLPHKYVTPSPPGSGGKPGKYATNEIGSSLYNLQTDPGEKNDVADAHPEVVARLQDVAERARNDLGDSATKREGKNRRAPGRLDPEKKP